MRFALVGLLLDLLLVTREPLTLLLDLGLSFALPLPLGLVAAAAAAAVGASAGLSSFTLRFGNVRVGAGAGAFIFLFFETLVYLLASTGGILRSLALPLSLAVGFAVDDEEASDGDRLPEAP